MPLVLPLFHILPTCSVLMFDLATLTAGAADDGDGAEKEEEEENGEDGAP